MHFQLFLSILNIPVSVFVYNVITIDQTQTSAIIGRNNSRKNQNGDMNLHGYHAVMLNKTLLVANQLDRLLHDNI